VVFRLTDPRGSDTTRYAKQANVLSGNDLRVDLEPLEPRSILKPPGSPVLSFNRGGQDVFCLINANTVSVRPQ